MAKRVNAKFVVILGGSLAVAACGAAGGLVYKYLHAVDMDKEEQLAAAAEKQGDMDTAMLHYRAAANEAIKRHAIKATDYLTKLGNLSYGTSGGHPERYRAALAYWKKALVENPNYKPAQERLMQELHLVAGVYNDARYWQEVAGEASKLIKLDPTRGEAYTFHAEAIDRDISNLEINKDKVDAEKKDLDMAMKLSPTDIEPFAWRAHLYQRESAAYDAVGRRDDSKKANEGALAVLKGFCDKNPNSPEGYLALAQLYQNWKRAKIGDPKTISANIDAAYADAQRVGPNTPKVYQDLASYQLTLNPDDAEKSYKRVVELLPENMEMRFRLGKYYYEIVRKPKEAIEAFKGALEHHNGVGVEVVKNDLLTTETLYSLCQLTMDMAETEGLATAPGKAYLAQASEYVEKVRGRGASDPALLLFDGRLKFLRNDNIGAIMELTKADDIFSVNKEMRMAPVLLVQTQRLLALAFQRQQENGLALKYLNKLLEKFPQNPSLSLQRAVVYMSVFKYDEALHDAQVVLDKMPTNDGALRIKYGALMSLNRFDEAGKVQQQFTGVEGLVEVARKLVIEGEAKEALDRVLKVLKDTEPGHVRATGVAFTAYMQLAAKAEPAESADLKAKAEALLKASLAKHPESLQIKFLLSALQNPDVKLGELQQNLIKEIPDEYDRELAFAQFYAVQGKFDEELKHLKAAEDKRPESAEVIDRIFNVTLAQGKTVLDVAEKYAQKAERMNLDGVGGKIYLGRLEMAKANAERAEADHESSKGDKADKDKVQVHLDASRSESDKALTTLQRAVEARPDFSMGRTYLGEAYFAQGKSKAALDEFVQAVTQKPDNITALKSLIALYLGQNDQGSMLFAQGYLKQAMKYAPRDPQLATFDDLIGDPDAAIRRREIIRSNHPEDMDNLKRLAAVYRRAGKPDKAIEILKPVFAKQPDDIVVADALAWLYRDTQKTDQALKIYQEFLGSPDPKVQFTALLLLAGMHQSLNQTREAISTYEQAIAKQPAGSTEAERRLGDLYFDVEDMAHAETIYLKLYNLSEHKDLRVLRRYVETMIRQDKFTEAQAMLDGMLKDRPKDQEGLVLKGYLLLRQRKSDEAIDCFNQVLADNHENTDALHYRAFAQFFKQGDLEQAKNDLMQVRTLQPQAIQSRLLLARVYRQTRMYPEAVHEYQQVLEMRPDLQVARVEYAEFLFTLSEWYLHIPAQSPDTWAQTLRSLQPIPTLQQFLASSVERFPTLPMWVVMQGRLANLQGNKDQTLQLQVKAFENSNRSAHFAIPYLTTLLENKQFDRVIQLASELLKDNADFAELYVKRGAAYAGQGKQTEALADYEKALQLGSKDLSQFLNVVRNLFLALPPDVSTAYLRSRLDADPKNLATRIGLAQVLLTDGKVEETTKVMEPLLSDPAATAIKPLVLRILALASYQGGDFKKARTHYAALLALEPNDLEALNNMAYLLADDLKLPAEGLKYAERAVNVLQTRPTEIVYVNNGNVLDTYGWILFLNHDSVHALDELQRSAQTDPLPITYLHIAEVLKKLQKFNEAKQNAEKASQLAGQRDPAVAARAQAFLKDNAPAACHTRAAGCPKQTQNILLIEVIII